MSTSIARAAWKLIRFVGNALMFGALAGWILALLIAFIEAPLFMLAMVLLAALVFAVLLAGMCFCNWLSCVAGESEY